MPVFKMSDACRKSFPLALLKEGPWLVPWRGAPSVACPSLGAVSRPRPPAPAPGDACGEVPAVGAGSRRGRELHRQRELRPRPPSGGDRGYPPLPRLGVAGRVSASPPLGVPLSWDLLAGIVPTLPSPGATCSGRGGPSQRAGGWGGHLRRAQQRCLRSQAVGDTAGGSRPVPCSRARISGRTRRCSSEERSRGSREGAESRATGGRSWRTPSLPVPAAAALGTLAPVGLPRLGLLPSARRGRAGSVSPCPIIFPILPPRRSPASPSPGAAVGPSGGCLCRTQRRPSPQPGLQRSALQVFLPHPPPALPGKG